MNAMKARKAMLKRKQRAEDIRHKLSMVDKALAEAQSEQRELSDYNAKLHVLNLLYVICRKNLKYGNKRMMRVLQWCAEHQPQFERDMADGVAWTKLLNEFKAIGITFENLDPKMIEKHQRSFEVGVRHYDEGGEKNDEV